MLGTTAIADPLSLQLRRRSTQRCNLLCEVLWQAVEVVLHQQVLDGLQVGYHRAAALLCCAGIFGRRPRHGVQCQRESWERDEADIQQQDASPEQPCIGRRRWPS